MNKIERAIEDTRTELKRVREFLKCLTDAI
jgi:hypothetical protein